MRDIMDEIGRVHTCIHSVSEKQDKLDAKVETVQLAVAHMQGVQETITKRIGVPNQSPAQIVEEAGKPVKKALIMGSMSPGKAVVTVLGMMGGLVIVYRLLAAIIPPVFAAIHAAIMGVVT